MANGVFQETSDVLDLFDRLDSKLKLLSQIDTLKNCNQTVDPKCAKIRTALKQNAKAVSTSTGVPGPSALGDAATTSVVLIGESHHDRKAQKHYLPLIERFKKTGVGFDCFFYEQHSEVFAPLVLYSTGKLSRSDAMKRYRANICKVSNYPTQDCGTRYLQDDEMELRYGHIFEIAQNANNLGLKIAGIDSSLAQYAYTTSDKASILEERNQYMFEKIKEALDSGACSKILVLNGATHLLVDTRNGKVKSIPTLLHHAHIDNQVVISESGLNNSHNERLFLSPQCNIENAIHPRTNFSVSDFGQIPSALDDFLKDRAKYLKMEINPLGDTHSVSYFGIGE